MDGHRIYPGELVALIAAVFVPALLVALVVEGWLARRLLNHRLRRFLAAAMLTTVVGLSIGVAVLLFSPPGFGAIFRIRDVSIGGIYWPFTPLAFISVALAAVIAIYAFLRRRKNGSVNDT